MALISFMWLKKSRILWSNIIISYDYYVIFLLSISILIDSIPTILVLKLYISTTYRFSWIMTYSNNYLFSNNSMIKFKITLKSYILDYCNNV